MKARWSGAVMELERGREWGTGVKESRGSSGAGGSPRNAAREVRRDGRAEEQARGDAGAVAADAGGAGGLAMTHPRLQNSPE